VNFGEILNEWDRETGKPYGKKRLKEDEQRALRNEGTETGTSGDENPAGAKSRTPEKEPPRAHPVDVWMRRYGIEDKDTRNADSPETVSPAERRRMLRARKPEAVIDLHGMTRDEAWSRLESFFADCRRRGLGKVLVIHGKGTHSGNGAVLIPLVRHFIEQHPHAGESGYSAREDGGSGSTWVILK